MFDSGLLYLAVIPYRRSSLDYRRRWDTRRTSTSTYGVYVFEDNVELCCLDLCCQDLRAHAVMHGTQSASSRQYIRSRSSRGLGHVCVPVARALVSDSDGDTGYGSRRRQGRSRPAVTAVDRDRFRIVHPRRTKGQTAPGFPSTVGAESRALRTAARLESSVMRGVLGASLLHVSVCSLSVVNDNYCVTLASQ